MAYPVLLLPAVADDLEELLDYIALHDSPDKATYVVAQIQELIESLAEFPNRGACVKELADVPSKAFREIHFKPYRVIYRVVGDAVRVYLVLDGRRDFSDTLRRRLLAE